jgi:hypothetical protein
MKDLPKVGTVVKFCIILNGDIQPVVGRIDRVYNGMAFINFCGTQYFLRHLAGLVEATPEEEVLWRFEQ